MSPVGLAVGDRCDGVSFREGLADAATLLERRVGLIDALNVFPVPDGDTGSNLALTMRAAIEAARSEESTDVGETIAAVARGALIGAHGNSGVILSRFLHGVAQSLRGCRVLDATALARALEEGASTARAAVDQPIEGTILTVSRDAARAAVSAAESGAPLVEVIAVAAREANAAVERTRGALPVLRQADVVDAGALGLATILEGVACSLRGEPLPSETVVVPRRPAALDVEAKQYGYCTEFVVHGTDLEPDQIRRDLRKFGDSILAVGDSSTVRVHLHTFTPGDAVEYGSSFGLVDDLKVEDMQNQNHRLHEQRDAARRLCGMLVIADGDGFVELFRSLGAVVVPDWRQLRVVVSAVVSILRTIDAEHLLILVDDPERESEVQRALLAHGPREPGVTVRLTDNPARSVAAALAFQSDRPVGANLRAIDRALSGVRSGRIAPAGTRSVAGARGSVVGRLDDGARLECDDLLSASVQMLSRLGAPEREIVTVYHGISVSEDERDVLIERVQSAFPDQRVESVVGGQVRDLVCLSCE